MTGDDVTFETGVDKPSTPASSRKPLSMREVMATTLADRRRADARRVSLTCPGCPEAVLTVVVPTNGEELSDLMARAEKRAKKTGSGAVWFNRLILAHYTVGIAWLGQEMEDDRGNAWTFASPELQEMVAALGSAEAVAAMLGSDAHLSSLASALMEESGFGLGADNAEVVEDPTTAH
jgi:hypothetical protein